MQSNINPGSGGCGVLAITRSLEEQLSPEQFVRISRSAIVNIGRIRELQPMLKVSTLSFLVTKNILP